MDVASRDVAVIVTTAVALVLARAHPRFLMCFGLLTSARPLVSPVTRMGRATMSLRRQGWRCSILDSPGMQYCPGSGNNPNI
ncbi:hypothetical protein T07_9285 [Trichinella nelsoni]|uniref:Uncharacterized protein n=1 Tax=Trichinella nelsoni TaxID=6336 RepID=A0A0V0S8C6_9BILA|nr:hypothetical protein T07_9285 [Trichinella nelsoni]